MLVPTFSVSLSSLYAQLGSPPLLYHLLIPSTKSIYKKIPFDNRNHEPFSLPLYRKSQTRFYQRARARFSGTEEKS